MCSYKEAREESWNGPESGKECSYDPGIGVHAESCVAPRCDSVDECTPAPCILRLGILQFLSANAHPSGNAAGQNDSHLERFDNGAL